MRWLAVVVLVLSQTACGTLSNGRGWGSDASADPGASRIAWAANRAARDPGTWIPTVGALLFAASGADQRVSDWAQEERPMTGQQDYGAKSDHLRDISNAGMFVTALLTPSGPPDQFLENKGRGLAVEALAVLTTTSATNFLKYAVGRESPNGNKTSFVSNHASEPFAYAALTRRNTDYLNLSPAAETAVDASFYLVATGTAWSRVEMGLHYPSDQLAGAALGNFLGLFFHDAFMGLPDNVGLGAAVAPEPMLLVQWRW